MNQQTIMTAIHEAIDANQGDHLLNYALLKDIEKAVKNLCDQEKEPGIEQAQTLYPTDCAMQQTLTHENLRFQVKQTKKWDFAKRCDGWRTQSTAVAKAKEELKRQNELLSRLEDDYLAVHPQIRENPDSITLTLAYLG